jgi:ribose 5-phosphate isomerase A
MIATGTRLNTRLMSVETYKRAAAARAIDFVRSGMRIGLGTGSTAQHFVDLLGERVRTGLDVVAVPTSEATRAQAERLGIALTTLDETPELDLTVDGADEIAPDLTLIKGGGGALLREKMVASVSAEMIVIADETKWVATLGRFPLPVEIVPFGTTATRRAVERAAADTACPGPALLRTGRDGHPFVTDGGHWLLDAQLQRIDDPQALATRLSAIPGVMEHGLFIGLARTVILAGPDGVRLIERL